MAVVPADEQCDEVVALLFFRKTLGFAGDGVSDSVFNTFLAFSSFGNIIVSTYTAARMKQEIAKQGFLPFPKFFSQNIDVSIGRLILHLRKSRGWRLRWISPQQHQEATPAGALLLHLLSCTVLVFATYDIPAREAYGYNLVGGLTAYVNSAFFGCFLALGILILRIWGPLATAPARTRGYREAHAPHQSDDPPVRRKWSEMTSGSVYGGLSVICACIYLVGNAFPLVISWIPVTARLTQGTAIWWIVPVTSVAVLGFASLWWAGFVAVAKYREKYQQRNLVYEIRPEFDWADPPGSVAAGNRGSEGRRVGGKILVHETILITWEGNEMKMFDPPERNAATQQQQQQRSGLTNVAARQRRGPLDRTDFDDNGPVW